MVAATASPRKVRANLMAAGLETAVLNEVSDFIAARMGLHFPEERWPDLARGLGAFGREMGLESVHACARRVMKHELTVREIETLASHLTVGETYFFRDPATFAVLERDILAALVAKHSNVCRTLRLWSAGCCTGEEAYSLAISCTRAVPELHTWNLSILATDINSKFLAKAKAGVYSEWSFRGVDNGVRDSFFSSTSEKKFAIGPGIRKLVQFEYLNLAEDVYPSLHNHTNAMDVICCRNVLMYFTPDHQRRVVAALHKSLVDGGYLLVSPTEASPSLFSMFAVDKIEGVTLYRKISTPIAVESSPAFFGVSTTEPPRVPITPSPLVEPIPPHTDSNENPLAVARACANEGLLEEALASCKEAIAAERTNPAAHFLYAAICHELDRLDEGISALRRVLYLDQDYVLAHYALGDLYQRVGKQRESKRHLAIALDLLSTRRRDEIVPESEGMTCGRLIETVRAMSGS
jgi:chemotaxis protein methyltransferase CheR